MAAEQKRTDESMAAKIRIEWYDLPTQNAGLQRVQSSHRNSKQIKVESVLPGKKNEVKEEKKDHEYVHGGKVALSYTFGGAATVITEVVGVELAGVMAGGALVGGVAIAGVAAVGLLAHSGYTYWCKVAEENNFSNKQKYNTEIKLYNHRLKELKEVTAEVEKLKNQLQAQEDKVNNKTFQIERYGANTKLVVAIGPTGYGKSLVCNRLLGDKREIFDLSKTKNAAFDVAALGDTKSNTKDLSKKSKRVSFGDDKGMKNEFILSVVDTQGAFDSDGDDNNFLNEMAEYFRACGGVNMFAIFFKFGIKNDENYGKLLKLYARFWGKTFWKKCVLIISNCDRDSKNNNRALDTGFPTTLKQMKEFLYQVSDGSVEDVPIYQFGEENFESSTIALLSSLVDSQTVYKTKYKCDKIRSPMDKLWEQIQKKCREIGLINKELSKLKSIVSQSADKISK